MKKNLLFLFLALLSSSMIYSQTYVDKTATGANDGSSWANAYTSLDDALSATADDDLWIAAGEYKPTGTNGSFIVSNQVNIYGSFAGTETSLAERDLQANSTVLNGDLNGDDSEGDFINNRSDNSINVMYIDSLLSTVILDGLRFSGGNTYESVDSQYVDRTGGGVFSYSTLEVSNCQFTSNYGRSGAGLAVTEYNGGGNGTIIENCFFAGNRTTSSSAGLYFNGLDGITVNNCEFSENIIVRGTIYPLYSSNIEITNCTFEDNYAEVLGFGGALFAWHPTNLVIDNCDFINNVTGNGGAMYIDNREGVTSADNVIIKNCLFDRCQAADGSAGAIRTYGPSMTLENNTFTGCTASGNGAAVLHNGPDTLQMDVIMEGNLFEKNTATFGGAMALYSEMANYTLEDNTFENNNAATSGGSMIIAFGAKFEMTNCTFNQDTARFGASLALQSPTTVVNIDDCEFLNGTALDDSGSINVFESIDLTVENSYFELNIATINGGIMSTTINEDNVPGELRFINNQFITNFATGQGGLFSIVNYNTEFISNVFAANGTSGTGAGGVMSLNAVDSFKITSTIANNTFQGNTGALDGGIATYTDASPESTLTVSLLNNIFDNEDDDYYVEDGTPSIISLGGNISTDDTMEDFLNSTNDIVESDDLDFVDIDEYDFHLESTSPAINNGISTGAPTTDIDGNPRIGEVETGAYEYDPAILVEEEILENNGLLVIKPNPVANELTFELNSKWIGDVQVEVMNISGQTLQSNTIYKASNTETFKLNVSTIQTGVYFLVVRNEGESIIAKMIKK